jgi:hypothetical protein
MASPNPNAGAGCLNLDIVVQGIDDLATFSQLAELYTKRVLSEMAFYGAYFVLSLIAFQTIFLRRERTGRTWILLSMLSLTFVLVTIYCILDLACLLSQISLIVRLNSLTVTAQTMSEHVAQIQTFYTQKWFRSAQVALTLIGGTADTGLLFVLTDGLSSWRAICIWTSGFRALIGIVPCFFTFCSLVCCIAYTVFVAQLQVLPTLASSNGTPISIFAILASTFSIVANITGTLMIGVTAYKLERLTRKTIGFTSVGTRILVFLTESGILYAMIQIVRLALCTSGTPCTPVAGSLATTFHIFERTTMIASVRIRLQVRPGL